MPAVGSRLLSNGGKTGLHLPPNDSRTASQLPLIDSKAVSQLQMPAKQGHIRRQMTAKLCHGSCQTSNLYSLLVMWATSPLEDRPLQHPGCAGSCSHSKLIYTASEIPQLLAGPDVKDIEDDSGLVPGVAGVLTAVGDEVLLVRAEVD